MIPFFYGATAYRPSTVVAEKWTNQMDTTTESSCPIHIVCCKLTYNDVCCLSFRLHYMARYFTSLHVRRTSFLIGRKCSVGRILLYMIYRKSICSGEGKVPGAPLPLQDFCSIYIYAYMVTLWWYPMIYPIPLPVLFFLRNVTAFCQFYPFIFFSNKVKKQTKIDKKLPKFAIMPKGT